MQATPAQRAQLHEAAKRVETAKNLAAALSHGATATAEQSTIPAQGVALRAALDASNSANDEFLKSFSKAQVDGLKSSIKKLSKVGANVGARGKAVERELTQTKINSQRLSATAEELARALADFRLRQAALGTEMGIQD